MAALTSGHTIGEWLAGRDPDGKLAGVAEMLHQENAIVDDFYLKEGNLPTGHQGTLRTSLGGATTIGFNDPKQPEKTTKARVTDSTAAIQRWVEAEDQIAELGGDPNGYMESEFAGASEAVRQKLAELLNYGNNLTNHTAFNGFMLRYNTLSASNPVSQNVISGGGSGSDNASILFVSWDDDIHGIYPKGMPMGLDFQNYGKRIVDTSAGPIVKYRARFRWHCGLHVRDWRHCVRICNIDISALRADSSAADLQTLCTKAYHRIMRFMGPRLRIYCNATVLEAWDYQQRKEVKAGGGLTYANQEGKAPISWRGHPIRVVDQMTIAEATVA